MSDWKNRTTQGTSGPDIDMMQSEVLSLPAFDGFAKPIEYGGFHCLAMDDEGVWTPAHRPSGKLVRVKLEIALDAHSWWLPAMWRGYYGA